MREVHGFGMYGMGGKGTDPGEITFTTRVRDELGVNIHDSPYRDYQANEIASLILKLPLAVTILVWGTSLGSNDCTVVATYAFHRNIDGIFGFQASLFGAKWPVPANVKFAHLIYSYNPIPLPGLGAYKWKPGPGFNVASLHLTPHHLPHPGDWDKGDQDMYLKEMRNIINARSTS